MVGRVFAAYFLTALAVSQATAHGTVADGERLPDWTEAVVKIFVSCPEGLWTGAGAVVSANGHILTAAHIGSKCIGQQTSVTVGFIEQAYREPRAVYNARLLWRRSDGVVDGTAEQVENARYEDIALYQIEGLDTRSRFLALETRAPLPGQTITVAGFSNYPFEKLPYSEIGGLSLFHTNIVSVAANDGRRPFRLHYSGATMGGMSGGPVVNAAGRLVGIHSSRRHDDITAAGGISNVLTNYAWATSVLAAPALPDG